jgi:hypothetical protein
MEMQSGCVGLWDEAASTAMTDKYPPLGAPAMLYLLEMKALNAPAMVG